MAYTSEEIQAAVEKLVRSTVRKTTDVSGVRNVQVEFDDIREIVAGVFIQYPNAPYYLNMLGLDRLHQMVAALIEQLDLLYSKIGLTGRRVTSIKDITALTDANQALINLEAALGSRANNTADPSTLPAYLQWSSSSAKYLNKVGASLKENGVIVETPNQAKAGLSDLFNQCMTDYRLILEYEWYLRGSSADYSKLQLPAAVAQNVVAKAQAMLAEDQAEMEALSEEERLEVAKDKALNIMTAQAIIDAYVAGQKVTDAITLTGTIAPYADDDHEAVAAKLEGDLQGPYGLVSYPVAGLPTPAPPDVRDNNILEFTIESGAVKVILPTSYVGFVIGNGKPQPQPEYDPNLPFPPVIPTDPNRLYTFYGDGWEVGILTGQIDPSTGNLYMPPALDASPLPPIPDPGYWLLDGALSPNGPHFCESFDAEKPEQWFFPKANDVLYIEQIIEGGATTRYTIPLINKGPGGDAVTDFQYPLPELPLIPPIPPTQKNQSWRAFKVQLTLQQVIDRINAVLIAQGSYLRAVVSDTGGVQIGGSIPTLGGNDPISMVVDRVVGVRIPKVVVATVETNTAAQNPLGFVLGLEMMSKRTPANSIVDYVNSNTKKVLASLVAYPAVPALTHMVAWTNMTNKASIVLAKYTGYATVVVVGTTATFAQDAVFPEFSTWGVVVGDIICLPRQYVKDGVNFVPISDEGSVYVVTNVTGRVLTAAYVSGPGAVAYPTRAFDVGLPAVLTYITKFNVAQIFTPPNDGAYEITSVDVYSPFRIYFGLLLSKSQQESEALPIQLEVTAGPASVGFASANLTPTSSIQVAGTCRPLIFSAPTTAARGTSSYVQLPETTVKVLITDKLAFWDSGSGPSAVRYEREVINTEERILTLNAAVPSNLSWVVSAAAAPSVTLTSGAKKNTDLKAIALEGWEKTAPANTVQYEQNMNAMLNPILVNPVPPAGKIADAQAGVTALKNKMADLGALSEVQLTGPPPDSTPTAFYVEPIDAVDDMLATLKAKSCDRAIDLLLMGRFSEFFGLDIDEMSYAGAMQKAARDVARNDLAVSRFGGSKIQRKILSMSEGSDSDYDHSDSDWVANAPDQVSGFDLPSAPDRA